MKVAGLQSKWLTRCMTHALEFDDAARGGKREPSRRFVFILQHFREEHLGSGGEAAAGHLLRIAHQLIEVNFGRGDKSADSAAALDNAFAFARGKSMARGHQADLMDLCKIALRRNRVTGMQLSGIDAPANGALNPLVGRQAVAVLRWHSLPRTGPRLFCRHLNGNSTHNKNHLRFPACLTTPSFRPFVTAPGVL